MPTPMRWSAALTVPLCMLLAARATRAQCQVQVLSASDGMPEDAFGGFLALEPSVAVVGARGADDFGDSSGAAYVFERLPQGWLQTAKLLASDGAMEDRFATGVALSGDTILIGALRHDHIGTQSGSAYVFERAAPQSSLWVETQELLASDGAPGDEFGVATAIEGDLAAVSAWKKDGKGAIYVFARTGGTWQETAKLVASDGADGDLFGRTLALSGNTLAVGAWFDDETGINSGSVYVYELGPTGWTETAKLVATGAEAGDEFSLDLALWNDTLMAGASRDDDYGLDSGSVSVFRRTSGSTWIEQPKLTAADAAANDLFGFAIALHGDRAVISAYNASDPSLQSGCAYVFQLGPQGWTQTAKLVPPDPGHNDQYGRDLGLAGDLVLVGVVSDDAVALDSGSARLHHLGDGLALVGCGDQLSLQTGDAQYLYLDAGSSLAGLPYLVLGSASGSSPGLAVDGLILPLNLDGYLLYTLAQPNSALLSGSLGVLDPFGLAGAQLRIPAATDPGLAGLTLDHAYVVLGFSPAAAVVFTSNAVSATLIP